MTGALKLANCCSQLSMGRLSGDIRLRQEGEFGPALNPALGLGLIDVARSEYGIGSNDKIEDVEKP